MRISLEPNIVSGNDVLTIRDLSKSFGSTHLFSHVDMEIKRGERVAIIGNNGTGKTTILKIINGLLPADTGTITLGFQGPYRLLRPGAPRPSYGKDRI